MSALFIKISDEVAYIEGQLTRANLDKTFVKKHSLPASCLELNLAKVSKIDTAGLAWLLLLIEQYSSPNALKLTNTPDELLKLAKLSGVESFLFLA